VWYFGSYSVADAFNLRQYKADFFQGENREFLEAIPLIHHTTWTFHQWFFFSLVAIQANPRSLILAYYADWEFSVWSTKN
jgi:hypothetical protein